MNRNTECTFLVYRKMVIYLASYATNCLGEGQARPTPMHAPSPQDLRRILSQLEFNAWPYVIDEPW